MTPAAVRTLAGWIGGSLRRLFLGVAGVVFVVGLVVAPPAMAVPAHAKVTGSEPADGAVVDRAPDMVALLVDAKPATIEGDPLRVYGPDGHRVDAGHATVSDQGRRISIGLDPAVDRPAGRYEIVYRIVSADTHLIVGRLSFEARAAAPAQSRPDSTMSESTASRTGVGRLLHGWPVQTWPPAVAGAALTLAAARLAWRRRRSTAAARRLLLPPMQGHLVASRTAYRPRSQPHTATHHRPRVGHAHPR